MLKEMPQFEADGALKIGALRRPKIEVSDTRAPERNTAEKRAAFGLPQMAVTRKRQAKKMPHPDRAQMRHVDQRESSELLLAFGR